VHRVTSERVTAPDPTAQRTPTDVPAGRSSLRADAERHLRALAGDDATLRDDQWTAIEALVVDRRRALVVQRTGWGKSAVYFVATLLLRAHGAGPTVIVSPLLALMRNQIAAAERAGIRAVTINSANADEWREVYVPGARPAGRRAAREPRSGLNNPGLSATRGCPRSRSRPASSSSTRRTASPTGAHDFRPDYRRIRHLLADLPPAPRAGDDATANARVAADVADSSRGELRLRWTLDRRASIRRARPAVGRPPALLARATTWPTSGSVIISR
jgi:ATP-dependent DNA helicase RecQ